MSCVETGKYFHEFMDKELDNSNYLLMKKHIDNCEICNKRHKFEMDIRLLVKAHCSNITAPTYLYNRILEGLNPSDTDATVHPGTEVVCKSYTKRKLFSSRSYAIAASLLISMAGGIFYYTNYSNDSTAIVDNAVKNHMAAVNDNLVFNEKTSVVGNVNEYLGNTINTKLNNTSPFLNAEQVSMAGGGPVRSYGTSSPCVIFNKGGNKLSLQVVRKDGFPITNLEKVQFGPKEFYMGNCRGFNSVLWEEDGATYCLTSDMDKNEMLRFAATLTSR